MSPEETPATTIASTVVAARECEATLGDGDWLLEGMRAAAAAAGACEHGTARAQYVPHGVTAVVFLAESHVLVSTWPESAFAYVEIALCGSSVGNGRLWTELRSLLRPRHEEIRELRIPIAAIPAGAISQRA
jgi:S-adenosylmethionine decarboxylase